MDDLSDATGDAEVSDCDATGDVEVSDCDVRTISPVSVASEPEFDAHMADIGPKVDLDEHLFAADTERTLMCGKGSVTTVAGVHPMPDVVAIDFMSDMSGDDAGRKDVDDVDRRPVLKQKESHHEATPPHARLVQVHANWEQEAAEAFQAEAS